MNLNPPDSPPKSASKEDENPARLAPAQGLHVMHLFFHVEQSQWELYTADDQLESKTNLTRLVQEIRTHADTQLLTFSVVTPKADLGFLLVTPCLHDANTFEKQLTHSLGPEILIPTYSNLSITCGADLNPSVPDWPIIGFFNTNMRRGERWNWYDLPQDERESLLADQQKITSKWEEKVRQLITSSVGIDDAEQAVTLFSQDTADIQGMLSELRSGPVVSRYTEFGEFYIGLQLPLAELFRRLML